MVCLNDTIHIYVDFKLILSTNSPDTALALLIAMYTIFELAFDKKSRTIRLLYSVVHGETRYLTNSIRILIKEKNLNISSEHQQQQHQIASNSSSYGSTTLTNEPQRQFETNSSSDVLVQVNSFIVSQTTEIKSSNESSDSNSNTILDTDTNE